jgi:hypothetical protein
VLRPLALQVQLITRRRRDIVRSPVVESEIVPLPNVCSNAGQQPGTNINGPAATATATAQTTGGPAASDHGVSFFVPRNHQQFMENLSAQTFCARIQMSKRTRTNWKI